MTLLAPVERGQLETEALIREARRLRRRRWTIGALLVALLGAGVASGILVSGSGVGGRALLLRHVAGATRFTVVDAAELKGHGDLAFVSLGALFLVDGATGKVVDLTGSDAEASDPQFSPNGEWLTYESDLGGQLWFARADGRSARRLAQPGAATWLPDGDLVVDKPSTISTYSVGAEGALRQTASGEAPAAVQPGGAAVYVTVTDTMRVAPPRSSRGVEELETATSPNGPQTLWYETPVSFTSTTGMHGNFVGNVTALPDHEGLLFTIDPDMGDSADGEQLYELRAPGGRPQRLGVVLLPSATPSYGPNGTFALGAGGDRYAWASKHVELCVAATARCGELPTRSGVLSLSPAWSPDHRTLAFVEANAEPEGAIGQTQIAEWYATHHLYLLTNASKRPSEVPDSEGAAAPIWSSNSASLMFVANDALFLIPRRGTTPVEVAGPLFTPGAWGGYYGELDWRSQFAWSAS